MRVLTFVNRKGGVGKTTSAINVAGELSARGLRLLCVDMDPQATLTLVAGSEPDDVVREQSTMALLMPELGSDPEVLPRPAPWGGDVIVTTPHLVGVEAHLQGAGGQQQRLQVALRDYAGRYDVVVVDSPPSIGVLSINAMVAADGLLAPVESSYVALGGLRRLFATVNEIRTYVRPDLELLAVFATQVQPTRHHRDAVARLAEQLGPVMAPVVIPRNIDVQDAHAAHLAVGQYRPRSTGARAYRALTDVIVERARLSVAAGAA